MEAIRGQLQIYSEAYQHAAQLGSEPERIVNGLMLNDGNAISTAAACVANSARVECTAIQLETQSVIGWTEQLLVALTVGDMLLGFAIKEARAGRLNELMMSFEGKVGQMVGLVASSTTELHTTAEGM